MKIPHRAEIAVVVVAVVTMVEVNLNEIKGDDVLDVVVVVVGDLLEEDVEVVVVADLDLIGVIVGVIEATAASVEKYRHFVAMSNF